MPTNIRLQPPTFSQTNKIHKRATLLRNFSTFAYTINFHKQMTTDTPQLNDHNKQEFPPMHSVEHLLNQTMIRMFGCKRSKNAHIERKKSKCDYQLPEAPTEQQIAAIEEQVNKVIAMCLPVTTEYTTIDKLPAEVETEKLPDDVSETIRLVRIGDYDVCACVGLHVENTSEIGTFKIISHTWENGTLRLRFKLLPKI